MIGQRICPIMSEPRGMVLCQGKNCSAACPRTIAGETYWFCEIIEGHMEREESDDELGIFQDVRGHEPVEKEEGAKSTWTVTEHLESPFEKVGRLYLQGKDIVIRSDLDHRGFSLPLADLHAVLDGDTQRIFVLGSGEEAGTVRLSTSGRAMNFTIQLFFYTTPLQSITRMLAGEQRKAPLLVGREQVE